MQRYYIADFVHEIAHNNLVQLRFTFSSYDEFEIGSILEILSPMEQAAVRRIVLEHETAAQLARELGCTRQSINQAKQRGLQKLRVAYFCSFENKEAIA